MSSLQLALQASKRLLRVAGNLCKDASCVQFCAQLKAILVDIIKWLQNLPDDADSENEAIELLMELDKLCRPQDSSSSLIRTEKTGIALRSPESRDPVDEQLLANSQEVTLALRILASDRKLRRRRKTTLICLESFLPQISNDDKIDISPSNIDLRAVIEDPPELGKEIISLHKALFTHCFCPESEEVIARIRLCNSTQGDDGKVTFGVLFMAHAHEESQPWWQDTHISVVQRTVNFEIRMNVGDEIRTDSDLPFCSYISAQHEQGLILLDFLVMGQRLYFQEPLDPLRQWGFDRPSISLGQLLEEVTLSPDNLTEKRKEVLSWLLAKATWQYYNSPWMLQPWNKESVHFLSEKRWTGDGNQLDGVFVNEPLLSISIAPNSSVSEGPKVGSKGGVDAKSSPKKHRLPFSCKPVHPIPKILALGIMLMEIQLCRSIETLYGDPEWSEYCPSGKANQNTDFKICRDLIQKKKIFEGLEISVPLENLIKACVQPHESFMPPSVQDEESIRRALYVWVNELEVYLSKRNPHNVKPLCLSRSTLPNHTPTNLSPVEARLRPIYQENKIEHPQPGRCMSQSTNSTSTKSWFKRMESLNYIFKAADDDAYEQVKIAVIDTGVKPNDAAVAYIAGYRDLVGRDDSIKCDNTGHGTTLINLIYDMCENALVYVVRIFETNEANDDTQALAIEAIDWCISQNMDIVCMAFGFNEYNERLHTKIHEASGKMLIFAAPTNEGNAGEIGYPAQYDSHVFCMFSTNGAVANSRLLNPTTREGYMNFAILGEDIKTSSGEVKEGTSFSTAIAAGLAGQLLEFSRHQDCRGRIKHASMMKVKDGMAKILEAMAKRDGHFNCLAPWLLLPYNLRQKILSDNEVLFTQMERTGAREHICNLMLQRLN